MHINVCWPFLMITTLTSKDEKKANKKKREKGKKLITRMKTETKVWLSLIIGC